MNELKPSEFDATSRASTDAYRDGWDRIFGKKPDPRSKKVLGETQNAADEIVGHHDKGG